MPSRNKKFKKAIVHHEQKCYQELKNRINERNNNYLKHKRKFRYALKDIRECNWLLNCTQTWYQYLASFFY
jgi:hypothetical protein